LEISAPIWLALLVAGMAMIRKAQPGRRFTIVLLALLYLAIASLALVAIEARTATYYWTSDFLESTPDGGFVERVPSVADLIVAFSVAHLGIAIILAGTSQRVGNRHRVSRALLCILVPPIAECVVRLGTWLTLMQWFQEGNGPELNLGVAAVSFLLPCAIGGGAVFFVSDLRQRTGHQPNAGPRAA
jgi:hypothetical protein